MFYICPKCYYLSETLDESHPHKMIYCDASKLTEEQRKPLYDKEGNLVSRAPRWFLVSVGRIEAD